MRNGRLEAELPGPTKWSDLVERRAVLAARVNASVRTLFVEGSAVLDSSLGLDIDRGGVADPGFVSSDAGTGSADDFAPEDQATRLTAVVEDPLGQFTAVVGLACVPRVDCVVCDGVPNGTGEAGETSYAQGWHRDGSTGSAQSNFTSSIAFTLRCTARQAHRSGVASLVFELA